jgi:ubiquinone/menaquinone biosynthesis C-methylase UbiE
MDGRRRFEGLAAGYEEFRPNYPECLVRQLARRASASVPRHTRVLVDVGAGTGISTRALRRAFGSAWALNGVEPGRDMRHQAVASTPPSELIRYLGGAGEQLPFARGSVGVLVVAQTLHWLDRASFYAEVGRTLVAGGLFAVINNDRDWRGSPMLEAHERFLERHSPGYRRDYRVRDLPAELETLQWTTSVEDLRHRWVRDMSGEEFEGMARSSSRTRAAVDVVGEDVTRGHFDDLLTAHTDEQGRVQVPYVTHLTMCAKSHTADRSSGAPPGRLP